MRNRILFYIKVLQNAKYLLINRAGYIRTYIYNNNSLKQTSVLF